VRLAVTTPFDPGEAEARQAAEAARRHALPFVPRGRRSLAATAAAAGADGLLVVGGRGATLFLEGEERRWQPGMGALRAKRLRLGERITADPFLEAAALRPGERVLDGTLGLGADALVAAEAVAPDGAVLAFESSPALAALTAEGLRRHGAAAGRIEVRCGDAGEALGALPSRSFDLVMFDPMFRHPRAEPPGFDLVRRLGDARPLSAAALAEAHRVARRAVLVKDGAPGWDLARLGLAPLPSARGAKRLYARIDVG
jgi:16S rRNA (guanine1516-N2)-methyltransferase